MDVASQKERTRLLKKFESLNYDKPVFKITKGKYGYTADARRFARSKIISQTEGLVPRGYIYDTNTSRFVRQKEVLTKANKLKKRFAKMKLRFDKRTRSVVPTAQSNAKISAKVEVTVERDYKGKKTRYTQLLRENFNVKYKQNWKKELRNRIEDRMNDSGVEVISIKTLEDSTFFYPKPNQQRTKLDSIRLRQVVLTIDGDEPHDWDSKQGTCVTDFIKWYYKDSKLPSDLLSDECFDLCFEEEYKTEGVSAVEIGNWCSLADIKMIALDEDYNLIRQIQAKNKPTGNKSTYKVLCYRIKDKHIHPVIDSNKIRSMSQTYSEAEITKRVTKKMKEKNEEKQERLNKLPIKVVKKEDLYHLIDGEKKRITPLDYLCKTMLDKQVSVLSENIKGGKTHIQSFVLDDIIYVFENIEYQAIKDFVELRGETYKGQGPSEFVAKGFKDVSVEQSKPNQHINEIFAHENIKDFTHEGGLVSEYGDEYYKDGEFDWDKIPNAITLDINKSHTHCITNPIEEFMILDFSAQLEDYSPSSNNLPLGMYFVETQSRKLFTGNKFYPSSIVKKGLEEGLIDHSHIKKQILATRTLPKDYFHKLFDTYKEYSEDIDISSAAEEFAGQNPALSVDAAMEDINLTQKEFVKLLNNTTSGFFGKTNTHSEKRWITTDIEQAYEVLSEYKEKDTFIDKIDLLHNDVEYTFYSYGYKKSTIKHSHNFPIYAQILAQQSIMLYDAVKVATNNDWSRLLHRKSDALTFIALKSNKKHKDENGNITKNRHYPYLKLLGDEVGQFKLTSNPVKPRTKFYSDVIIDWGKYQKDWKIYEPIKSSYDCEEYFKLIEEKKSLMTVGEAGCGKSFLIDKMSNKYKCLKLSFMNVASLRIGGETIHSKLNYDQEDDKCLGQSLQKVINEGYDCVIVDEQGTLTGNLWRVLYEVKLTTGIPFFLFGDWWQLKNLDGVRYNNHEILKSICDQNITQELEYHDKCRMKPFLRKLIKPLRSDIQDMSLRNTIIDKLRQVEKLEELPFTNIVYTNKYKNQLNKDMNRVHYHSRRHVKIPKSVGEFVIKNHSSSFSGNREFFLFTPHIGMPIICIKNNKDIEEMKNGQRYTLVDFSTSDEGGMNFKIRVNQTGTIHEVSLIRLILDFDLAYAMTNHKIIGDTLTDFCIHQPKHPMAENDWLYTAISRGTKMRDVKICPRKYSK